MTHHMCSKCDLSLLSSDKRLEFDNTFIFELFQILSVWDTDGIPDRVVVFNGRFIPYCLPFFLARFLDIPVYVHERGRFSPHSVVYGVQPSAPQYKLDIINTLLHQLDVPSNILSLSIRQSLSEVRTPSNFPQLFDRPTDSLPSSERPIILFIVSSDDEVDCGFGTTFASAQRSAIKYLSSSPLFSDYDIHIKIHPRLYDFSSVEGISYTLKFFSDVIESLPNVTFHDNTSTFNPFNLVDSSDCIVGLHSTLIEYAWLKGKKVITHIGTDASCYLPTICDFHDLNSVYDAVNSCFSDTSIFSQSDLYEQIKRYSIRHLISDADFGPLMINDYFYGLSYPQLSSLTSLIDSNKLSADFNLLVRSIISGSHFNHDLLKYRLNSLLIKFFVLILELV